MPKIKTYDQLSWDNFQTQLDLPNNSFLCPTHICFNLFYYFICIIMFKVENKTQ